MNNDHPDWVKQTAEEFGFELAPPGSGEKWLAEIYRIIRTPIPEDAVHADEPLQPLQNKHARERRQSNALNPCRH
jgi:hypothetical protein